MPAPATSIAAPLARAYTASKYKHRTPRQVVARRRQRIMSTLASVGVPGSQCFGHNIHKTSPVEQEPHASSRHKARTQFRQYPWHMTNYCVTELLNTSRRRIYTTRTCLQLVHVHCNGLGERTCRRQAKQRHRVPITGMTDTLT